MPMPNIATSLIFWRLGLCRFQGSGIGTASTSRSIVAPMTAADMYKACWAIHDAAVVAMSQTAVVGRQGGMKKIQGRWSRRRR